jgi:acyl transferase domain-containing protein/NADPH:quinone reductase-like Zn-dependent oxidoreductase/NADP-dependent 3-hydroxy acid dehydrogenase YdfG/acyl carrier protein
MPGTTPAKFWDDLLAGRDLVTEVDSSRWSAAYLHPSKNHPGSAYTFAAGSLGNIKGFDAGFFAISPREAALMDPQQRLLLEMSWETLENAGIPPPAVRGSKTGVYIGIATVDYSWRLAEDIAAVDATFATGNTSSIAANRISYVFDLRGPSMAIDTACSSSLVAFHQACRAIVSGEVTQALAGAVSLHLHPLGFVSFSKAAMLSRRGRCSVFDAAADGYVRSEGGGVFLLKDFDQAVADGNPILAVVAHSAVNTDGRKSGLTVPSCAAQASLLMNAYADAGIEPWEIDYLEAHGTGTAVGDPIETRALGDALGQRRAKSQPLLIGSVKGNVGHLEAASGVAGLIKAVYCLRERVVPAHIGMETPNPNIPFEELNLEVLTANRPLKKTGRLIVGVNSFGFGGANAHVILESHVSEASATPALPKASALPIVVSARDSSALSTAAREMAQFIAQQPQSALYDVAYQSVFGRERHAHCAVLFGTTPNSIATRLHQFADNCESSGVECGTALSAPNGAAFIYSGNGAQWVGMGAALLADPTFRSAIHEVDRLFSRYADYSLEAELMGKNGEGRYDYTEVAQPALFAVQVGITVMLRRRGLVPTAVAGHSVGEVAAAWASGALSLAAAVSVIHHRSALQGSTKGQGGMTAANLDATAVRKVLQELKLTERVSVAGVNSWRSVTLAGPTNDLDRVEQALSKHNVAFKRLALDYAFHSASMDGLFHELRRALGHLEPDEGKIPFYSTVTGQRLEGKALNAEYWWRNVRKPVQFAPAIRAMADQGINIYLEIGPHAVLNRYVQDGLTDAGVKGRVMATGARGDDSPKRIFSGANQALIAGAAMDWKCLLPWRGRFMQLPNYPWQKEDHWHTVTSDSMGLIDRKSGHPLLGFALAQTEFTWENTLDTLAFPDLADHCVGGAVVFPAAGYAELALAAADQWQPFAVIEIEDLEVRAPLLLGEEPSTVVRCVLDPRDGQFSIKSREQLSTEAWTLHGVGRILREATSIRLNRTLGALPTRLPDFTDRSHAVLTQAAGLEYGPAFQAIRQGWLDDREALAELQNPQRLSGDLSHFHLPLAFVDCGFQLVVQLLRDSTVDHIGVTFVPTRIGRLIFQPGLALPRYVRARLLSRGPHSVHAEFELYDETQRPIAVLEEVRFRAIRLVRNATEQIRCFEYTAVPRPLPLPLAQAATLLDGGVLERLDAALAECFTATAVRQTQAQFAGEVDPLLDELCNRFVAETLSTVAPTPEQAAQPFHAHLVAQAQADGLLNQGAEALGSALDIWNSLIGDYPDYFFLVHAVGAIGLHLSALLDGRCTLNQVLPSQVSLASLLAQSQGSALKHRIESAMRLQIAQELRRLDAGRRFNVVEISEAAPPMAAEICRTLDFDRADYHFVSSDANSLEEARRLQEKFPSLTTGELFAESAPRAGDLAIVTLDFRALHDALRALKYARTQLAPGGVVMVVGQHPARWLDFVLGADPAWWSDSRDGGPLSRQQPVEFWQARLRELGFGSVCLHQHPGHGPAGSFVLTAACRVTAQVPSRPLNAPRHWLLLADDDDSSSHLAANLAETLRQSGDCISRGGAGDVAVLAALLEESIANLGPIHGIVSMTGLSRRHAAADAISLLDSQVARCADAAALLQACDATHTRATCTFVTAHALTHLLPQRLIAEDTRRSAIADAPLAGLIRTVMNESPDRVVRLVDLETPAASVDSTTAALARELQSGDTESEIILTAQGGRYVPRLRAVSAPRADAQTNAADEAHSVCLSFVLPGQLRSLHWERQPRRELRGDEVEVVVHATGLNFRDVMYALGLLSDQAVESGFSGSSLGLEFSGIVAGLGPSAEGFVIGDRVVGFSPSSFADRVITRAPAMARIPAEMSFAAAATIPSAFFTAYYSLHHLGRLQPGEKLLIHGAAGGVGIAAIQIAKWCGAEIFATAGSTEKRDFLRLLGVEYIFDSRNLDYADQILELTQGKGVDVILNSLAGEAVNRNLRVLKPFGRFLELGKRDFYENTRVGLRPFRNNLSYFGIDVDQLMAERPDLTQRLFTEVLELFAAGTLHPLPYRAFDAADVVDAFRHMQQSKHIGKIVVTYANGIQSIPQPVAAHKRRLELAADETFLVTGGLSGFGLRTAEWLTERGARNLILLGRRGITEESKAALARLERRGVKVMTWACDITDKSALIAVLESAQRELPPLKGIVHAAMVIEDGLIRDAKPEQIRRVLAPKVLGAQLLHDLTLHMDLNLFVLYSSATTLFGNPGQGSYVAANFALEALARQRRSQGLPATCVRWGAIGDVGFLARNHQIKDLLQSRMGGAALHSSAALESLEAMLLSDRSDLGVLDLDWRALSRSLPTASSPKFAELARDSGTADAEEEGLRDWKRLLTELPDEELLATVIDLLKREIGEILRIQPDKLDAHQSMSAMGLDSLMGVELAVAVENRFGMRLPVMALSDSPTVTKLAAWIIAQLRGEGAATTNPHDDVTTQIERIASRHAENLGTGDVQQIAVNLHIAGNAAVRRMIQ